LKDLIFEEEFFCVLTRKHLSIPTMDVSKKIKPPTPKRIGSTIKHESINPTEYNKYQLAISCDDCVHFRSSDSVCTLGGYQTHPHLKSTQLSSYELNGTVAFCRFIEIE
jgi:hypothetical protein